MRGRYKFMLLLLLLLLFLVEQRFTTDCVRSKLKQI